MSQVCLNLPCLLATFKQLEQKSDIFPTEWTFDLLSIMLIKSKNAFPTERVTAGRGNLVLFWLSQAYWASLIFVISSSLPLLLILLYPHCIIRLVSYELLYIFTIVNGERSQNDWWDCDGYKHLTSYSFHLNIIYAISLTNLFQRLKYQNYSEHWIVLRQLPSLFFISSYFIYQSNAISILPFV